MVWQTDLFCTFSQGVARRRQTLNTFISLARGMNHFPKVYNLIHQFIPFCALRHNRSSQSCILKYSHRPVLCPWPLPRLPDPSLGVRYRLVIVVPDRDKRVWDTTRVDHRATPVLPTALSLLRRWEIVPLDYLSVFPFSSSLTVFGVTYLLLISTILRSGYVFTSVSLRGWHVPDKTGLSCEIVKYSLLELLL